VAVSVVNGRADACLFASLLATHHYLSYRQPVGENLPYLVRAADTRPVAAVLFGAAAWRCAARDRFIGWDDTTRAECPTMANNRGASPRYRACAPVGDAAGTDCCGDVEKLL